MHGKCCKNESLKVLDMLKIPVVYINTAKKKMPAGGGLPVPSPTRNFFLGFMVAKKI